MEGHLEAWTRAITDQQCHGTTGEAPIERFRREEAQALKPLVGIPPFTTARDLVRRVGTDCAVKVDGNAYSVPWRLIGEREIARRDQRRIDMGFGLARFPIVRELASFDFAAQPSCGGMGQRLRRSRRGDSYRLRRLNRQPPNQRNRGAARRRRAGAGGG
ncbi:hypothetical protein FZ983_27630 [Azospirillum sp. B21]|nr:hypothetical protein FZ983_27630 [Azospirillum sp. B21]